MTPTEELLSSVLAEEAAAITGESLRPVAASSASWLAIRRVSASRLRVLAAVGAAVSILLVIGLLVLARSVFTAAAPFADVGTATSPPRYYVGIDPNDRIVVQSTATGHRTDVVGPPEWLAANSNADAAVAVSADGRTFVAAYNDWSGLRTALFRFTVTSDGRVAGFSLVRTGHLPGLTELSVAISPNAGQLALAGIPDRSPALATSSGPPRLLVVNLKTGQIRTWHGLAGTGAADSIENPAWMADGTLRFLVLTCHGARVVPYSANCEYSGPTGSEWTLSVRRGSAPLGSGRVLVRLPGVTVQAQNSPGGDSIAALQILRSGGIRIAQFDVPTGRLLQILYRGRGAGSNNSYAGLAADGAGKYLLINEDLGTFFGWIGNGQFHRLPVRGPYGPDEFVAATW